MRLATASDSVQRRGLLRLLRMALDPDSDYWIIEALNRITVVEPNLLDLTVFVTGASLGEKLNAAYTRGLELRCMPYREYLQTAEWAVKREEQLIADDFRCRLCNGGESLQVHHRTYRNRGDEQPGDLTTLCGDCHRTFHANSELARV